LERIIKEVRTNIITANISLNLNKIDCQKRFWLENLAKYIFPEADFKNIQNLPA
jgi:uncharacterized protein YeeX (DUF496 family)